MREILFRGKSVNDGNWVEGSLVITTIEPVDDTPIKHYHIENMTIGVFPDEFQSGLSETVNPNTVGQFTGLTDKNGKRIFEGDVCRVTRPCVLAYGKITFENGCFWFVDDGPGGMLRLCDAKMNGFQIEVIGNIHDNPELLEVPNGKDGFIKP